MRAVLSTSCPISSVALFDKQGALLASRALESRNNSSGAVLEALQTLLKEQDSELRAIEEIVVDVGPGSFTGCKVGVTVAKVFAWSLQTKLFGVTAFDLIDCQGTAYVQSKKGEFYLRAHGEEPVVTRTSDGKGYGDPVREDVFPSAARLCAGCLLVSVEPEAIVPLYIAPPSISVPKDPRVTGEVR